MGNFRTDYRCLRYSGQQVTEKVGKLHTVVGVSRRKSNRSAAIRPYSLLAVKERRGPDNFRGLASQRAIMENGTRRRDEFE